MRDGDYGGLVLGPAAKAILRGEVPVSLKVVADRPKKARAAATADVADGDRDLFEALRAVRRELAASAALPPYVIFHDSTLRTMAASRPQTRDALARIPGVGASKLEAYGEAFLAVLTR
jgi:ATP-dependent DNA helicase RecQ